MCLSVGHSVCMQMWSLTFTEIRRGRIWSSLYVKGLALISGDLEAHRLLQIMTENRRALLFYTYRGGYLFRVIVWRKQ